MEDCSNITPEQKFYICTKCEDLVMTEENLEGTMHFALPGRYFCDGILRKTDKLCGPSTPLDHET